jgi:opacity protein-like surface antigen
LEVFGGAGSLIGYYYDKETFVDNDPQDNETRTREAIRKSWQIGLSSVLGVEWRFAKNLALLAEYELWIVYSRRDEEQRDDFVPSDPELTRVFQRESDGFNVSLRTVKFGLSAYF